MADRVVKVSLIAQASNFVAGLEKAKRATQETSAETKKANALLEEQASAMNLVGGGLLKMGAIATATSLLAVSRFAEFDAAMSNVSASTNEGVAVMSLLRDAALDAGANTVYSATEAANAIEELSKAGVDTADILSGALNGSLDLAAAGGLGVARAAEISATALQQFGLSGGDAAHVADVLAAGAGKAMGSVDDLAQGLKFVGPVAASMGVSLEETTGVLALFAQQGIIGEQAGTSLRGVLGSLTAPSAQARTEIERLGIQLYDAGGNFLGLENAAGQLSNAYSRMDGASRDASLGIIFGRETVTAATALYRAGAQGVEDWTAKVDDSGYAAEQAAERLDNLKGDLEGLMGALDSALIQTGSGANDSLRELTQSATAAVQVYNDFPPIVQSSVLAIGSIGGAGLLAAGGFLTMLPRIAETKAALSTLNITAKSTIGVLGSPWSIAAIGAGLALGVFIDAQIKAKERAIELGQTLDKTTGSLTNFTRETVAQKLAEQGSFMSPLGGKSAFDAAKALGVGLDEVTDAALGNSRAFAELERSRRAADEAASVSAGVVGSEEKQQLQETAEMWGFLVGKVDENRTGISDYRDMLRETNTALDGNGTAVDGAATAYEAASEQVDALGQSLEDLLRQLDESNNKNQDAISANASYQQSVADVDEYIQKAREGQEGYGLTLDRNTAVGAANTAMLADSARQAEDAAAAQLLLDGDTTKYLDTLNNRRDTLIRQAEDLGYNKEQAHALADEILNMPTQKEVDVLVRTNRAHEQLDALRAQMQSLADRGFDIPLRILQQDQAMANRAGGPGVGTAKGRADGGAIVGPGGPRSDSIAAWLSNGEHVLDAEDVRRMGGQVGVYRFRQSLYADGGAVHADYGTLRGSQVQYVPSYPSMPYGPGAGQGHTFNVNNVVNPPPTIDPYVMGTVTGRTFADAVTGLLT